MKKLAIILTQILCCIPLMGAAWPFAPVGATLSVDGTRDWVGRASIAIGFALLIVVILRAWRMNSRTRKKYEESERRAYSYKPRGERVERTDADDRVRARISMGDMDFPSGFGGINDMEQLVRNREMYKLYSELKDEGDGWDDARR